MSSAPTRDEAVTILREGSLLVNDLLAGVPQEDFARAGTIGGDWSAKDLVGHLTFWQENALSALKEFRNGESSSLDRALKVRGLDAVNLDALAAKAALSSKDVRVLSAKVDAKLVERLGALAEAEWSKRLPGGETWGSELGSILGGPGGPFRHAWAHLEELTDFVQGLSARG